MTEEYHSIMENDVLDIVPRPERNSVVNSIRIYKINHVADGSVEKYKARFVSHGFSRKKGIDFEDMFSLVAIYTTIRYIISLASVLGWKLHYMDVKTSFLNGEVEEDVYIENPEGFVIKGKKSHVCNLKKTQYGLKQDHELGMLD